MKSNSQQTIGQLNHGLNADQIAVKRWLRMSLDRQNILPKQVYLEISVDAGTWSRWTSYEHEQTIPSGLLPAVLRLFDAQARIDLLSVLSGGGQ